MDQIWDPEKTYIGSGSRGKKSTGSHISNTDITRKTGQVANYKKEQKQVKTENSMVSVLEKAQEGFRNSRKRKQIKNR